MASDTAVTEFTEENAEQTGLSGVENKKETDILLLQIKKRKRTEKTKVTKLRHELERVCLKDSELTAIESVIEQLWTALENAQETLEELIAFYVEVGDEAGKKEGIEESESIEKEVRRAIEAGQTVIKTRARKTVNTGRPISVIMTDNHDQQPSIRSNDIHALEKFADLVRITVVKLQAEGKDGELGDGTLHSLMVKKLPDRQLENYSRWLNDRA